MKDYAIFLFWAGAMAYFPMPLYPAEKADDSIEFSFEGTSVDTDNYWRKEIPLIVTAILTNTSAIAQDFLCLQLETALGEIENERLLSLPNAERERFAQSAIGKNNYQTLEDKLLKQLAGGSNAERVSASWALGCVLFSSRAVPLLKESVFSSNRELQMNAVQSLSAIGVSGADDLQLLFLLSGVLPAPNVDFLVRRATSMEDRKKFGKYGLEILSNNRNNPIVASGLVPALQTRDDFKKIAMDLLKKDEWKVPDVTGSELEDQALVNFVSKLLFSLTVNKPPEDIELVDVFRYYANDTTHVTLYMKALRYFECSDESEAFFRQLQQNPKNPPEKVRVLSNILQRIQQNQRLRFEEENPKPENK